MGKTAIRIALAAGIIGSAYWLFSQAKAAFSYTITSYGSPSVFGTRITLPITVRFNNPTPIPVNIESIHADIFISKNGTWVRAGVIDQTLSIPSGQSDQTIQPTIDPGAILGGGITSILLDISNALRTNSVPVRTDIRVKYAGVELPTKSFTSQVAIS